MNISAIKSYQPNFQASAAVTKTPAKKQIDVKKVAITAVGLTVAGLAAWALINKIRAGKVDANKDLKPVYESISDRAQTSLATLAEIPVKKGEKLDISKYSEGQKLTGLINTAKMDYEIAQVETRLAKHDELQKMYEKLFSEAK